MMNLRWYCVCIVSLTLNGCATFGYTSTADYVEAVFRRQNAIATQVMMLTDIELSTEDEDELLQAETQMLQNCRLLNAYAVKEMNHESTSLLFKKRVKDSAESCDESVDEIESLLDDFDLLDD